MSPEKANLFGRTGNQDLYTAHHTAGQDRLKLYIYPTVVLSFKATSITTSLLKTVLRQAAEKLSKSSNFRCLTEAEGE